MAASPSSSARPGKFGTLLWTGSATFFLTGSLAMLGLLVLSGKDMRDRALESAKRIEFTPDFAQVQGKLLRLADIENGFTPDAQKKEEAPKAEEHPATDAVPPAEHPAEEHPAEEPKAETPPAAEPTPAPAAVEEVHPVEPAPAPAPAEATPQPTTEAPAAETPAPAAPAEAQLAPVQTKTAAGIIPIIAADGTQPWQYFSKQAPAVNGKPRIAVVLYGLGQARLATEAALALPAGVTLSFSPYSRELAEWSQRASGAGHETLLDLPMETERYPAMDPGPYGLLNALPSAENYKRLEAVMARMAGYVGLLMPLKETVSNNTAAIASLVSSIKKHGVILLGSENEAAMPFSEAAIRSTTPILHADLVLDARIQETHIQGQLALLEQLAKKQGFALAIGRSFPVTVEQVAEWTRTLDAKGIELVPLTNLVPPPAAPAAH